MATSGHAWGSTKSENCDPDHVVWAVGAERLGSGTVGEEDLVVAVDQDDVGQAFDELAVPLLGVEPLQRAAELGRRGLDSRPRGTVGWRAGPAEHELEHRPGSIGGRNTGLLERA